MSMSRTWRPSYNTPRPSFTPRHNRRIFQSSPIFRPYVHVPRIYHLHAQSARAPGDKLPRTMRGKTIIPLEERVARHRRASKSLLFQISSSSRTRVQTPPAKTPARLSASVPVIPDNFRAAFTARRSSRTTGNRRKHEGGDFICARLNSRGKTGRSESLRDVLNQRRRL